VILRYQFEVLGGTDAALPSQERPLGGFLRLGKIVIYGKAGLLIFKASEQRAYSGRRPNFALHNLLY
jgi:hypothetical protein